jgi:hypothetical protein
MSQIGQARFGPPFSGPNLSDVGHKNYPSETTDFETSRSFDRFGQIQYWRGHRGHRPHHDGNPSKTRKEDLKRVIFGNLENGLATDGENASGAFKSLFLPEI